MFAVKGWSVDSSTLKPQTEVFKSSNGGEDGSRKRSRKRKRGREDTREYSSNNHVDENGAVSGRHLENGDRPENKRNKTGKKHRLDKGNDKDDAGINGASASTAGTSDQPEERWQDIPLGTRKEKLGIKKESKKEKRNRERLEREGKLDYGKSRTDDQNGNGRPEKKKDAVVNPPPPGLTPVENLTPMQSAMRQKLVSSRFRYLNQTLYTEPSSAAQKLFDQDPAMFEDYHAGFRQQVSVWPENPVDKFVAEIRRRANIKPPKVPKRRKGNATTKTLPQDTIQQLLPRTDGTSVIVDMGCGDARFAQLLTKTDEVKKHRLKISSYDLHSPSPYVTKADISRLPVEYNSVNIAICCLALMGTNWISFIEEAFRILHWKGELWIAEIKSRFGRVSKAGKPVEHSVGSKKKQILQQKAREAKQREDEEVNEHDVLRTEVDGVESNNQQTDVSAFVAVLKRRGFILKPPSDRALDMKNKMFVRMEFVKALMPTKGQHVPKDAPQESFTPGNKSKTKFLPDEDEPSTEDETTVLKPCFYKIR